MKNPIAIITVIAIAFLCIVGLSMFISYNNTDVELRSRADMKRSEIEAYHDKMWKTIQQQASVTSEYKNGFKEIYTDIIAGRYSGGSKDGSLMKWIQESNPTFSPEMYTKLMATIESERAGFFNTQKQMLDIKRQHTVLLKRFPSKFFISDTSEIEFEPITSTKSKQVMETGVDDDVKLF